MRAPQYDVGVDGSSSGCVWLQWDHAGLKLMYLRKHTYMGVSFSTTCLSVYLSYRPMSVYVICPSVHPSIIDLSIYPSACVSVYMHIHMHTCIYIYITCLAIVHVSINQSICLSIHRSIHLFIYETAHISIHHRYIYLSIFGSNHLHM